MIKNLSQYLSKIIFFAFAFSIYALTLFPQSLIYAADVSLAWNANTEPDLAGYNIYYKVGASGAPYNGTNSPINVPLVNLNDAANPQYTVFGLSNTEITFFVVTAYDTDNNESGYSNEVSYQPVSAPMLSSLSISGSELVNESSNSDYTATATFSDGTTQIVTESTNWSENSPYAQINTSGKLTTSAVPGNTTATIQASYSVGGVTRTASKIVTITDIPVSVILSSLSVNGEDFVNENNSANFTATATFSDGTTQVVTESTNWSENSPYAQINTSGTLTTSEVPGDTTATIQASYSVGGVTRTASKIVTITDISVSVILSSLSVNGEDFVNENNSANFTATATFSDGTTQVVTESTNWSENSPYAQINTSGTLTTSEVPGDTTATIQASYSVGGVTRTASKIVTITDISVSVILSSLSVNGEDFVNENNSANFTATATFSDGTTQVVTESTNWSENSPYAQINTSGTLTTSEVPSDTTATIQASYSEDGITKTATQVVTIVDVPESNLPPNTPVIVYPENGQNGVEEPLEINTEPFSDSNDDAHSQTQWQISEQNDFSTLVLDIISDNYLTVLTVPYMVLKSNQKYYTRIRFYDFYSEPSEWSTPVEFTTTSLLDDLNSNGISDANEVDDTVDSNQDGIPDNYQPEIIKSVRTVDGSTYIGIEKVKTSKPISEIEALEILDPKDIADTVNRPDDLIFGLVSYRLRVSEYGDTASLKIRFSGEVYNSDIFYKYDTIKGWVDYSEHVTFNNDNHSVTIELKDGGYGDSDGLANGIIVDPFGLAADGTVYTDSIPGDDGSTSGIKGCFIATAAFGSKYEKHVQLLRRFRDLYLMPHRIGRAFVNTYYRYSPPLADLIADHDAVRALIRWSLLPLIGLSWMLLHFGAAPTGLLFVLMITTLWMGFKRRYKELQVKGAKAAGNLDNRKERGKPKI